MTTHKVSAETPSTFFTAPTSAQNLRSPFRYEAGLPPFLPCLEKPPTRSFHSLPIQAAFFTAPALPPTPCRKNILGKVHTVKPNQLTRVLPRHAGRDSHITILRLVWFFNVAFCLPRDPTQKSPQLRRLEEIRSRSGEVHRCIERS